MGDRSLDVKARVFSLHKVPDSVARRLDESFAMVWHRDDSDVPVSTLVEHAGGSA